MNVLVVGSGGREHALAWKLVQSRDADDIFIAPGNAGTAQVGTNLPVIDSDTAGLIAAAREHEIGLTAVGPEAPLAAGLVDAMDDAGLLAFGPTRAAAEIESSKAWAKAFMGRHGIPTAVARAVESIDEADAFLSTVCEGPAVVKADGLAGGKGVIMTSSKPEAILAVKSMLGGALGDAGKTVVLEETLTGRELSVFAFVDGETVSAEVAACDYKRIGDGDEGPNTGGMGAYAPPEFWSPELAARIRNEILQPAARGMVAEDRPYRGFLYAGLMVTDDGPKVIEFNCRMGDPEGGVVLPTLRSDLLETCIAVAEGRLGENDVSWDGSAWLSVVAASDGYPGSYETGHEIQGLEAADPTALVFHAGTARDAAGRIVTSGGRVLAVVAPGADVARARQAAYSSLERISFEGITYRSDIALRAEAAAATAGR